jgi:cell division protein FtsB
MGTETNNQTGLMRRYLLGLLPEPEQVALEERFFEDGEILREMRAVEQDLVDAYVRGQLGPDEKSVFESHYLSVHRRAERVAFAGDLLRLADAEPELTLQTGSTESREPFWRKWLSLFQTPQFAMSAAGAMIAILVVSGLLLFRERARWRQELAKSQAEQAAQKEKLNALEQEIAKGRADAAQLAAELEQLRQQQLGPPEPAAPATIFSFLLLPTSRGAAEQQTLRLAPNAARVRLQMKIRAGGYKSYRVRIDPIDGGNAWESASVTARSAGISTTLSVLVPARNLPRGDYNLELSGIDANGAAESIENYSFRVSRP